MITVTIDCEDCGTKQEPITLSFVEFHKWTRGKKIQDAFPELTPAQRELLISGSCEPCFDKMWKQA